MLIYHLNNRKSEQSCKKKSKLINMESGFTLIEISLVLLIVTILLGYTVSIYPVQQELKQYRAANEEMDSIFLYLIRFAQVNGRLPCPDKSATGIFDGLEDLDTSNDCKSIYANLPGKTIGIPGTYNEEGSLLDPWGRPYRYAISDGAATSDDADDFSDRDNIKSQGINVMKGDIYICDNSAATGNDLNCVAAGSNEVMSRVAAVVVSTGKDRGDSTSNIQAENMDNFDDGASNDRVFIYTQRSEKSGSEYDDVVKWLPTNLLLSKLIEAGKLP